MNLFGLSPLAFVLGALGLAAGLGLLHLLRVRLRTVEVDTLLFFRLAGALQKPRVLPGRPARLWAFALALMALLLAWSAVAAPRSGLAAPSRFVVVEPDLLDGAARAERVQELLASGLGPRGAVFAATSPPTLLLAADEPANAFQERALALRTPASPAGEVAALAAVADRGAATDEVLWVGALAPATAAAVVHVPVAKTPASAVRGLRWQRHPEGALALVLRCEGAGSRAELRSGTQLLAQGTASAGAGELALGPFVVPAGVREVQCVLEGASAPFVVPVPTEAPLRVFVDAAVPARLAAALGALVQADAELVGAPDLAGADVLVVAAERADEPRPQLVITPGVGTGPRRAVATDAAPVALSLRDRARAAGPALPPLPGARTWFADAAQGDALVAATATESPAQRRIHIVDWLLQPVTHADVPVLLSAALRALGGRPETAFALVGQLAASPAHFPVAVQRGGLLPVGGSTPAQSGAVTELAPVGLPAIAAPLVPAPAALAERGDSGSWVPTLLLLLVLLLTVDAVLFHRGRLP